MVLVSLSLKLCQVIKYCKSSFSLSLQGLKTSITKDSATVRPITAGQFKAIKKRLQQNLTFMGTGIWYSPYYLVLLFVAKLCQFVYNLSQ